MTEKSKTKMVNQLLGGLSDARGRRRRKRRMMSRESSGSWHGVERELIICVHKLKFES